MGPLARGCDNKLFGIRSFRELHKAHLIRPACQNGFLPDIGVIQPSQ
jgi:hypothetical protein